MLKGTYEVEGALKTAFGLLTERDIQKVVEKARELQAIRQRKYDT